MTNKLFTVFKSPISNPVYNTILCTVPVPEVVMSAGGVYKRKKIEGFLHFPQSQAECAYSVYPQAGTFNSRVWNYSIRLYVG
jgi:hypothetical protein